MSGISDELRGISSIQEMSKFVGKLQAQDIGEMGGRRFQMINNGSSKSVSLNDVVKKLNELTKDLKNISNEEAGQISTIVGQIKGLDDQANEKLNNASSKGHKWTIVKSFIGNIGFNRHKVMDKIDNQIKQLLEVPELNRKGKIFTDLANQYSDTGEAFAKSGDYRDALKAFGKDIIKKYNKQPLSDTDRSEIRQELRRIKAQNKGFDPIINYLKMNLDLSILSILMEDLSNLDIMDESAQKLLDSRNGHPDLTVKELFDNSGEFRPLFLNLEGNIIDKYIRPPVSPEDQKEIKDALKIIQQKDKQLYSQLINHISANLMAAERTLPNSMKRFTDEIITQIH